MLYFPLVSKYWHDNKFLLRNIKTINKKGSKSTPVEEDVTWSDHSKKGTEWGGDCRLFKNPVVGLQFETSEKLGVAPLLPLLNWNDYTY